jgi:hypothetical protein
MRRFLVGTAAYMMLMEGKSNQPMKSLVEEGGEIAADLFEALIQVHADGMNDIRTGPNCAWHEHTDTPMCKRRHFEMYQYAEMGSH